jgi:hypothetical protein
VEPQDCLSRMADQSGGDIDEAVAQGGDHRFAFASTPAGELVAPGFSGQTLGVDEFTVQEHVGCQREIPLGLAEDESPTAPLGGSAVWHGF